MKKQSLLASGIAGLVVVLALRPSPAADWPQWQGPDRNNVSKETGLLKQWPKAGPKLLWSCKEAGIGYSGPAIVGDRLYAMGAWDGQEWLFALDVKSGQKLWTTPVGKLFVNGWGDGPRGTPTVDGKHVYGIGGQGNLICAQIDDGKQVWLNRLKEDLGGEMMSGWGYTESPLVDGDLVVCTPGGKKGTLAALDKAKGDVRWRSKDLTDKAAYSSLVIGEACGVRQYVLMTGESLAGVSPKEGRLLWRYARKSTTAAIPTPIVWKDEVYATSSYGAGCALVRLSVGASGDMEAKKVYQSKVMENHHGGVVLVDGCIYGCSGNSTGRPRWTCQDFQTGESVWQDDPSNFSQVGSITYADGRLYCYGQTDGTVVLAEVGKDGWKEQGRFRIPMQTKMPRKSGHIWTHPVVANGKLYLRDEDLIFCYDISAR